MTKVYFRSYIHKKMILFPQRIDKDIAEDDPVRLLDALVDNLMLDNVYKLYKPSGRKPYHPQMMLKVILYAYMNNIYSCRRIELLLKRDIHFIYLAGYEQPDFITINRFRNRVKKEINNIFTQVVLVLAAKGLISLDVEYIDGTKIESKANKYTFVWKRTVEKNRAKLQEQIRTLLLQVDDVIAQDNAAKTEGVFGQTKYNKAYKRFRQCGKDKVNMDFAFFAIAFNIGKMCKKTNLKELKDIMEVLLGSFRCSIQVYIGYLKPYKSFYMKLAA